MREIASDPLPRWPNNVARSPTCGSVCTNGVCACDVGYRGIDCSAAPGQCIADCSGKGTCIDGVCKCKSGYEGDSCQVRLMQYICPADCSDVGLCQKGASPPVNRPSLSRKPAALPIPRFPLPRPFWRPYATPCRTSSSPRPVSSQLSLFCPRDRLPSTRSATLPVSHRSMLLPAGVQGRRLFDPHVSLRLPSARRLCPRRLPVLHWLGRRRL